MYTFNKEQHLHTLDGKPLTGTSSVLSVIAKPLTWWASGLAVAELGWIRKLDTRKIKDQTLLSQNEAQRIASAAGMLEHFETLTAQEYLKLLDKAYRAHADSLNESAEAGTDLHEEAEKWVKSVIKGKEITPHPRLMPFVDWYRKNCKGFLWSEAHCYSREHWVGGITDCGVELNNGEYGIVDFKSSKEAYPSQFWQIAGYDIQITENGVFSDNGVHNKKLDKSFTQHIVVPFGAKDPLPIVSREVESGKRAFLAALEIYRQLAVINNQ